VYVQKNLWTPLGMTRSYVNATPPWLATHRSNRYHVERDSAGTVTVRAGGRDFDPGVTIPNGGWNAPIDDVATWMAFLTGRAGPRVGADSLLRRATLAEMWTPVVPVDSGDGIVESMGLGFFLFDVNGRRLVGHTGDQGGFRSFMAFDPASGRGVIGVVNTSNDVEEAASGRGFNAVFHSALQLLAH
jgi:CubicO group peptidase (beta-lactamase class C family)